MQIRKSAPQNPGAKARAGVFYPMFFHSHSRGYKLFFPGRDRHRYRPGDEHVTAQTRAFPAGRAAPGPEVAPFGGGISPRSGGREPGLRPVGGTFDPDPGMERSAAPVAPAVAGAGAAGSPRPPGDGGKTRRDGPAGHCCQGLRLVGPDDGPLRRGRAGSPPCRGLRAADARGAAAGGGLSPGAAEPDSLRPAAGALSRAGERDAARRGLLADGGGVRPPPAGGGGHGSRLESGDRDLGPGHPAPITQQRPGRPSRALQLFEKGCGSAAFFL